MGKTVGVVLVVLAIVVVSCGGVFGLYAIGSYNGMVTEFEAVNAAWGQVENVYQRRMDLIPNLVATVQGYAAHEKEVFTQVADARSRIGSLNVSGAASNPALQQQFLQAQQNLGTALTRLIAVAENYPTLKASENFLSLQSQLEGTENRIAQERRKFQVAVQAYNQNIKQFPRNFMAGLFGFSERQYFAADEGAQAAPKVSFQ